MKKTLQQHLDPSNGPKRILSLDGGGIRGALSLGYLHHIENILRKKHGDDYRLCDHFDLIGGTSTGSIIAGGLAIGKTVKEIHDLYMELGGKIFGEKHNFWNPFETWNYLKAKYEYKNLEKSLRETFGDILLGGNEIKTGLCIVAKRADTNSTWPLINHPKGKFFDSNLGKNKDIPLWKAIRASSAAPTYFAPQMIDVGNAEEAAFVDGGVSLSNNPALLLLMVATLKGFPFHWEMGEDNISLVSVGTGYTSFAKHTGAIEEAWLKDWAVNVPDMLMQDASWQNQIVLQWLSNSPVAKYIDMEMEYLQGDYAAGKPMIKYLRYNFEMNTSNLEVLTEKKYSGKNLKDLVEMSNADNRFVLYDIGLKAGAREIDENHILSI